MTKIHMEALSPTMEEGQLVKWLKKEGDAVTEGDVLAEIETDKATMELVARGSGVLRKQLLQEGASAQVGSVIGVIAGKDEDIGAIAGGAAEPAPTPAGGAAESASAPAGEVTRGQGPTEQHREEAVTQSPARSGHPAQAMAAAESSSTAAPAGNGENGGSHDGRTRASPLARRLAAEAGVDLSNVQGSGPGGRIVKRDIEQAGAQAAPARASSGAAAPPPAPAFRPHEGPEVEEIPVSQMRKTIAKRLVTSIGPVPTFYLTVEVDMTQMSAARERLNARYEKSGIKISVNDLLVKAVSSALSRHPEINAAWGETVVRRYRRVHIGVAVAVEDGLITPVIRDADRKGVAEIAQEVRELAGRARERKLTPEEYTGATFSISNLGMFGIDEFTAIINPPEAAILAVGRVEEKPVVVDGGIEIRPRLRMTMSCDHRVIDGATGAKFLQTLRDFIEEPVMMLV